MRSVLLTAALVMGFQSSKAARLTMLAGKGHGITDNMLSPVLYAWLLTHRRERD